MRKNGATTAQASALHARPIFYLLLGIALLIGLALLSTGFFENDWGKVVTLGLVEGFTEFLPISSTAHLIVAADLLHFQNTMGGTFEIFIQMGAVLAVLGFYARDLLAQARAIPSSAETRRFWFGIVIAFLPAALVGIALHDWIKQVLFSSPAVIAGSLIIGGMILIWIERRPQRSVTVNQVKQVSWRHALGVGLTQVFSLIPGVSRSGATIVGGMLAGLDRPTATAFSFYLAIPTLGAATAVDLLSSLNHLAPGDLGRLALGAVVAMVTAWLSIGWLLRYVSNYRFVAFGVYRILAGLIILALIVAGQL